MTWTGEDWPAALANRRADLLRGLDAVIHESDRKRAQSLAALLDLDADLELHDQGRAVLMLARALLDGPCPLRELPTVAILCKVGMESCIRPYRRALGRIDRMAMAPELAEARVAFLAAFTRYSEAARTMNGTYGAVIFFDLEAPLGGA